MRHRRFVSLVILSLSLTALIILAASRSAPSPETGEAFDGGVPVSLVGPEGMRQLLDRDPSARQYFERMSRQDVLANTSGCTFIGESASSRYLRAVMYRVPGDVRARAAALVRRADLHTARMMSAERVPWRVAVLRRGGFGAQYPHTLGDVVCLPIDSLTSTICDAKTVRTLVHERVHIYQRLFPEPTRRLLVEHWHLTRVVRRHMTGVEGSAMIRSNPDLDGWLWTEAPQSDGTVVVAQVYTSRTPADLSASAPRRLRVSATSSPEPVDLGAPPPEYEHPYERMAYEIEAFLCDSEDRAGNLRDWWETL